jgi:hypothetical protein
MDWGGGIGIVLDEGLLWEELRGRGLTWHIADAEGWFLRHAE